MNPEVRSDFPVTRELTFLDTAYTGPLSLPVLEAGRAFLERRSRGHARRIPELVAVQDQVRDAIADLINAEPSEVAITTNTTEGTNIVATSLSLGPRDHVVWGGLSFDGNMVVWRNQGRRRGFENRIVKNKRGMLDVMLDVADFERVVDSRTKVISVSYVSNRNGYVNDVEGLANLAHAHGAYLHVDAVQAVGAIQVDVKKTQIDFLTCGTYKWLLGPMGLAFFYVREEVLAQLEPAYVGWMGVKTWAAETRHPIERYEDARKFQCGTRNYQGVYELRAALDYINQIGMDRVEEQVLRLSSKLWKGLDDLGIELVTPPETRSGIVTCVVSDAKKVAQFLEDNKIIVSPRPERAGKALRFSPHFFNTEEEIDHLLSVLESAC